MFSIIKLCYYQIRGRSVMYGLSCIAMVVFILFGIVTRYGMRHGEPVIDKDVLISLLGVIIPFFSCFMILPFAEEIMNTELEETTFLHRNKIDFLFLIQNVIYYVLIWIIIALFGGIYASVCHISYQIYFLCIYLQLFTAVCYFVTRSNFATCGILFFYLSVTLAFSLLETQELSLGWLSSFGAGRDAFFKAQGWKMIVMALAAVFSVINRRQMFAVSEGRSLSNRHQDV